jgi:hypothetical protein
MTAAIWAQSASVADGRICLFFLGFHRFVSLTLHHLLQLKEKSEKENREMAKLQEQERIRSGKELAKMKNAEVDQERARIVEWRKREKREEVSNNTITESNRTA